MGSKREIMLWRGEGGEGKEEGGRGKGKEEGGRGVGGGISDGQNLFSIKKVYQK